MWRYKVEKINNSFCWRAFGIFNVLIRKQQGFTQKLAKPCWLIVQMTEAYRQRWTDFADSLSALSIIVAKALTIPLTLLSPTRLSCHAWVYSSVSVLSQTTDTAFPKTLHQSLAQQLNQAGNRCKRTQRQPELRLLKASLASVFVWLSVIMRL